MRIPVLVAAAVLLFLAAPAARAGSDTPPPGPTWERDLVEAQRKALSRGLPIFLYFTKTY